MAFKIPDRIPVEDFIIENNVIKGVQQELPESYQFGQMLFDVFDSKPNHVIQVQAETGEQTTFMEMKENSVRCALWLKKLGIGRGDIVTICAGNYLDTYIPIFASFYVGAIYNAWNHRTSLKEVQRLMRTIKPKIVFVTKESADIIVEASKLENFEGKIIAYDRHFGLESLKTLMQQQSDEEVKSFQLTLNDPEDIAFIILSSGTTGFPKGVMHSYRNLMVQISAFIAYSIKGVVLLYSGFYWITGLMYFLETVFNCGLRVIHSQFDPETTCQVIEKYKVEQFRTSPTDLRYLCKSNVLNKYHLKSLKLVFVGGSKVSIHTLQEFRKRVPDALVFQAIGSSEIGRTFACYTDKCKAIDTVGFVMSCTELKIRDLKTNESLENNRLGEICVKSKSLTKGYYKNESETKAAIDDEGWFHTGDIGYYDENGEIFIVDRLKEIMKYQNHQVSPNEIEEVLLSHPAVLEVAVVPIPHEIDGDHAMAFVKKSPDLKVTEVELIKLSETLGELKKLHGGVKFIDEIPKTPTGKIARQILKERAKTLVMGYKTDV